MRLRRARPGDLERLLALEQACYPPQEAYGAEEYVYALRRAHAVNFVVEREGRKGDIVGFAGAFLHDGHRIGHVFTLNVRPDTQRKGLGRRLLAAVEDAMRDEGMTQAVLEVGVRNRAARALYLGAGYAAVDRVEGYYASGEDALRMSKPL